MQASFTVGRRTSENMLILISLASAVRDEPPAIATATAVSQATVQVLRVTARASEADWRSADAHHKSEVLIKEKDGGRTRLRLIEYQ